MLYHIVLDVFILVCNVIEVLHNFFCIYRHVLYLTFLYIQTCSISIYIYIYVCVHGLCLFFFQSFLLQWLRRRSDESQAGLWWVDASQYEVMFQWLGWFEGTPIVGTPQLVTVLVIIYTNSICGLLLRFIVVLKQYEWQKTNCWPRFTTVTDWLINVVVRKIQKVFD